MSKTVYKFSVPVDDKVHEILVPPSRPGGLGPSIGHVACQADRYDEVQFWAEVDTEARPIRCRFLVVGTGHTWPEGEHRYVGSAMAGPFVWHLLEVGS